MMGGPASISARQLFEQASGALNAGEWDTFAWLVHDEALANFRRTHLDMARAWADAPYPDLPADLRSPGLAGFARVESLQDLEALDPATTLARWLEGTALRPDPDDPTYEPPVATRTVVGEVAGDDTTTYVVYRLDRDVGRYGRTYEFQVVQLRHTPDGWRLMLNNELSFSGGTVIVHDGE